MIDTNQELQGVWSIIEHTMRERVELRRSRDNLTAALQLMLEAIPEQEEAAYEAALLEWETFANRAEQLAGDALALESLRPGVAVTLVGGQIIEYAKNIVETAEVLSLRKPPQSQDPIQLIAAQPRAYENIQRCLAKWFPDDIPILREQFKSLGLPTHGFLKSELVQSTSTAPEPEYDSSRTLKILHLSDLHRTLDEPVENMEVFTDLKRSLKENDSLESLDLVVVSGDLTQLASPEQYKEARELLTTLANVFLSGDRSRLILVPGNHDVDWSIGNECPFILTRPGSTESAHSEYNPGEILVTAPVRVMAIPSPKVMPKYLKNFRELYRSVRQEDYPLDPQEQAGVLQFPNLGVAILTINTCYGMHHLNDTAEVCRAALVRGIEELDQLDSDLLRMAIGHHGPVTERKQHDAVDTWVFDRLRGRGVDLYLHGHVHESRCMHVGSGRGRWLTAIGVGSAVAGSDQRPESTPRQYNLITIDLVRRLAHIAVRKKERRDQPWDRDRNYDGDEKDEIRVVL